MIVQGRGLEQATAAVETLGGERTHELGIINTVGTQLSSERLSGSMWNDGFMLSNSLTESMSVNVWVDQE